MKAAYKPNREKGIKIVDVPVPRISENEVLVKVKKAAICGTDIHLYEWNNWCENVNAKNPMIIGHEFCGEVWHQYSDDYITETMIHELGHTLGYGHVDDPSDIMYFEGSDAEYAIESHEKTSIPGYVYFIPACTFKDSTQYQYEVSVDDNAFRFNTYFVHSYQEY